MLWFRMFMLQAKREMRRKLTAIGVESSARLAAKNLGWNGKETLVAFDRDGSLLFGFTPR